MDKKSKKDVVSYTSPQKKFVSQKTPLGYEEKLKLMLEYMNKTGNPIKNTTIYKGYNLSSMKANLRTSYWKGTLKSRIDSDLLQAFLDNGILSDKKERIRTSGQEKYDFLMSLIGKDEKELSQAKMANGVSYSKILKKLQFQYNRGKLDLAPSQIEDLMQHGFLSHSPKEIQEQLSNEYGIPQRYMEKILQDFGSAKNFIDKYKRNECDFDFGKTFVGPRIVTVSSRDLTEKQKLAYYTLYQDAMTGWSWSYGWFFDSRHIDNPRSYLDIDVLDNILSEKLDDITREDFRKLYGLDGEKVSAKSLAESRGISGSWMIQKKQRNSRKLRNLVERRALVSDPYPNELNSELQALKKQRSIVSAIETIFIAHKISPYSTISDLDISDEAFSEILDSAIPEFKHLFPDLAQHSLFDICEHSEELYKIVEDYIYGDCDYRITCLEEKKEKGKQFDAVYSKASDYYFNSENIFDPDTIVPAIKREKVEEMSQKSSLYDYNDGNITSLKLPIYSLMCLHNSGIRKLNDIYSHGTKKEDVVHFLESINGLTETDINTIVNKLPLSLTEEKTDFSILSFGISTRGINILIKNNIMSLDDLFAFNNGKDLYKTLVKTLKLDRDARVIESFLIHHNILDPSGDIIAINGSSTNSADIQETEQERKAKLIQLIQKNQKLLRELEQQITENEKNKDHSDDGR